MNTYLLDTSVIIDVLNGKRARDTLLLRLLLEGHLLACCAVNVTEVYAGMRPHEQVRTDVLVDSFQYIEITKAIAKHAGRLKFE